MRKFGLLLASVGVLCSTSVFASDNYQKAIHWYTEAAQQGHAGAQNNLGSLYFNGKHVEQDYKKSFELFKAASGELIAAQYNLGLSYLNGYGTEKDVDLAVEYFLLASSHGDNKSKLKLAELYFYGDDVEKDYKKSLDFLVDLPEDMSFQVNYLKGKILMSGEGVEPNYTQAISALEHGAKQNHVPSIVSLGFGYKEGVFGSVDLDKALSWFEVSAALGHAESQYNAAMLYLNN